MPQSRRFWTKWPSARFYTTGDYAYPTERLLTLSTCTYQMDDARMVILARPLRDGETTAADEVHINSDPLLPARCLPAIRSKILAKSPRALYFLFQRK